MIPEPEIVTAGRRLVEEAAARGIAVRLLGGVAVWLRASDSARAALGRGFPDLDLVARKRQSRGLRDLLEEHGYEPERVFNATHGAKRLLYHAPDRRWHIDVFLDEFAMSHTLDLGEYLDVEFPTLPAAQLLLTKLQVAELNLKDASDTAMLLIDHEPAETDGPDRVNVAQVAALTGADWGLHTTVVDNLVKVRELLPQLLHAENDRATVSTRLDEIERALDSAPKSRSWKMRAKIGRRKRWYELPEEVVR